MGPPHTCILLLILATISDLTQAACVKQKLLEDILSPSNAERALQILRLAAVGANRVNPKGPSLLEEIALPKYLPSAVIPAKQIVSDVYPRRLPALPCPRAVGQPIIEVGPLLQDLYPPILTPTVIQENVYPAVPIPQPRVTELPAMPVPYPSVPGSYPLPPGPYPPAPVPLVNPFLPAASPVSAMAPPTSSLLPPVVPTQVRSHFLRKIPIPPPSL